MILPWPLQFQCAAHPSVYGITGSFKTRAASICAGEATWRATRQLNVSISWVQCWEILLNVETKQIWNQSHDSILIRPVTLGSSFHLSKPPCSFLIWGLDWGVHNSVLGVDELVFAKQPVEPLARDKPSVRVFISFAFFILIILFLYLRTPCWVTFP